MKQRHAAQEKPRVSVWSKQMDNNATHLERAAQSLKKRLARQRPPPPSVTTTIVAVVPPFFQERPPFLAHLDTHLFPKRLHVCKHLMEPDKARAMEFLFRGW